MCSVRQILSVSCSELQSGAMWFKLEKTFFEGYAENIVPNVDYESKQDDLENKLQDYLKNMFENKKTAINR